MAQYKHTHKYVRDKLGKLVIFKCALPNCPHYIASNLAVGKLSVCWYCGAQFLMTKKSIRLKKPHCKDCFAGQVKAVEKPIPLSVEDTAANDFLKNILPGVVDGTK